MAVYSDNEGWQNKQFLGRGEFALTFGNYEVDLTVPDDFIVGATGSLQNPEEVLTSQQLSRFEKAKTSFDKPVLIVTEKEAKKNEGTAPTGTKTWKFKADDVRDFAFGTGGRVERSCVLSSAKTFGGHFVQCAYSICDQVFFFQCA